MIGIDGKRLARDAAEAAAARCHRGRTKRSTGAAARSTNRSTGTRRPCPAHGRCWAGWTSGPGRGQSRPRPAGSRSGPRWRPWAWAATRPSWTARRSRMPSRHRTCCWQRPTRWSSRRRAAGASAIRPGTCAPPPRPAWRPSGSPPAQRYGRWRLREAGAALVTGHADGAPGGAPSQAREIGLAGLRLHRGGAGAPLP